MNVKPRIQTRNQRTKAARMTDPWQATDQSKPSDQPVWLISYLDVMTLLFSFFVLLFAYQKTTAVQPVKPISTVSVQQSAAPLKPKRDAPNTEASTTAYAIAAMKLQASKNEIARDAAEIQTQASSTEQEQATPAQLRPALDAMIKVGQSLIPEASASEQTATQLASVLTLESERKQVDIVHSSQEVRMEVSDAILFDPASAALREEGLILLDRLAPVLTNQVGVIAVEGHSDNAPIANQKFPSNWELSSARATAVTRYLLLKGLPADHLRAVGMADTHPRADNQTAEGRAKNRRVSLVVYANQK